MATMPQACPVCGSTDTWEKHDGDPVVRECDCEAFWYVFGDKLEVVTASQRESVNTAFAEAESNRLFGADSGW